LSELVKFSSPYLGDKKVTTTKSVGMSVGLFNKLITELALLLWSYFSCCFPSLACSSDILRLHFHLTSSFSVLF